MKRPIVSIIIATYNSSKHLPLVLESIRRQTFPNEQLEVLIIDGGSTDTTKEIAQHFGYRVIPNPKVIPAWAKYIGYRKARGKYIMYLDSDEMIFSAESIQRKLNVFASERNVRAVTGSGYRNPHRYAFINRYINEFGDPFSFFMYRLSKDERYFIPSMKTWYKSKVENSSYVTFDFAGSQELPIFELAAMGSMVDGDHIKKKFPEIETSPGLIPHMFYLLVSVGAHIGIVKHDSLVHYSASSMKGYLAKIRSRVINNIYTNAKEGFRGRDELIKGPVYKRYVFLPYALTVVGPLVDAFHLALSRRHIGYLLHVPLCLYTAGIILYYTAARSAGFRSIPQKYG